MNHNNSLDLWQKKNIHLVYGLYQVPEHASPKMIDQPALHVLFA